VSTNYDEYVRHVLTEAAGLISRLDDLSALMRDNGDPDRATDAAAACESVKAAVIGL